MVGFICFMSWLVGFMLCYEIHIDHFNFSLIKNCETVTTEIMKTHDSPKATLPRHPFWSDGPKIEPLMITAIL